MSLQGPPRRRPRDYAQQPPGPPRQKFEFRLNPLAMIAAALAIVVALIALAALRMLEPTGSAVALPRFSGMALAAARREASAAHVNLRIVARHPDTHAAKDQVIGQYPAPGEHVREGRTVDVVISDGPTLAVVPNLSGKSVRDAIVELGNVHLELGNVAEVRNTSLLAGNIFAQHPDALSQVAEGAKVDVVVAEGRTESHVPNFVGLTIEFAQSAAHGAGVNLGPPVWLSMAKNARPRGIVAAQDPLPGRPLWPADKVVLRVSSGPLPTPTPLPTIPPILPTQVLELPSPSPLQPTPVPSGATPTAAPAARSMRVSVKLPSFPTPKRIRVALVDAVGSRDLYDENTTGGLTLSFDVTVTGFGTVQTYVEGELVTSTQL